MTWKIKYQWFNMANRLGIVCFWTMVHDQEKILLLIHLLRYEGLNPSILVPAFCRLNDMHTSPFVNVDFSQ